LKTNEEVRHSLHLELTGEGGELGGELFGFEVLLFFASVEEPKPFRMNRSKQNDT
jgi:hypothetical protein